MVSTSDTKKIAEAYAIATVAASSLKITTMAEIISTNSRGGRKRIRAKKLSTKIDMTPMVDLAFLLLTFFILTSSLQKQKAMDLTMPDKNDSTDVRCNYKDVLHIVLGDSDQVFYWMADEPARKTTLSNDGIRKVLLHAAAIRGLRC